jgi:hypothetical protein
MAKSGDVNIAYQVVGEGKLDLVFVSGWISNVELAWEEPNFRRFLERPRLVLQADPLRQARHRAVRPRLAR